MLFSMPTSTAFHQKTFCYNFLGYNHISTRLLVWVGIKTAWSFECKFICSLYSIWCSHL